MMRWFLALLVTMGLAGCLSFPSDPAGAATVAPTALAEGPFRGVSSYDQIGACTPQAVGCSTAFVGREDHGFRTNGTMVTMTMRAEWTSELVVKGVRISLVQGSKTLAEGVSETSPMTFAVPPLPRGDYQVKIRPHTSAGLIGVRAEWTISV